MTANFFPSWEPIPPGATFTIKPASCDKDVTPGKVYQAISVGSRIAYFLDDNGNQKLANGRQIVPA